MQNDEDYIRWRLDPAIDTKFIIVFNYIKKCNSSAIQLDSAAKQLHLAWAERHMPFQFFCQLCVQAPTLSSVLKCRMAELLQKNQKKKIFEKVLTNRNAGANMNKLSARQRFFEESLFIRHSPKSGLLCEKIGITSLLKKSKKLLTKSKTSDMMSKLRRTRTTTFCEDRASRKRG